MSASSGLTIREVSERTGIGQPTLRMWEQRFGFPEPRRLASGHRRDSEEDVDQVLQVEADRRAGMSLPAGIARARAAAGLPDASIYAGLRRARPDLDPFVLPKRTLIAMSHAIEDECAARAERPLLFASFQRESFYRSAEPRWRELARSAELAVVFADFAEERTPADGPIEVPIDRSDPLGREWSLVCEGQDYSACLAAREPPGQDDVPDADRSFETVWSVQAAVVRDAVRLAVGLMRGRDPNLVASVDERLERPAPPNRDEMRLVSALTSRMVAYVGSGPLSPFPAPRRSAEA